MAVNPARGVEEQEISASEHELTNHVPLFAVHQHDELGGLEDHVIFGHCAGVLVSAIFRRATQLTMTWHLMFDCWLWCWWQSDRRST